jgi:hypothetical protein
MSAASRDPARAVKPTRWPILALASLVLLGILAATALPAGAQEGSLPPQFWQRCDPDEPAGQSCTNMRGLAANPDNGHIYLADLGNRRIVEHTAWGQFVRAWGWGVIASGPNDDPQNEIQQVTVDATAGDFELGVGNLAFQRTEAIAFDATAAEVQSELEGIGNANLGIEPGDVAVSGPAGGPWTIEYVGELADRDFVELGVYASTLSGGGGASVATTQKGANFEVCVPDEGDVCRAGDEGSAPGQFLGNQGIAVDSAGDVYVLERDNSRVQKFSPDGEFELMFGGGVNQGGGSPANPGDLCTAEHLDNGDVCGAGTEGTGPGEFGALAQGDYLTVGPADEVYVGGEERIQRFDTSGVYQDEIALPGETVKALDVDPDGNLYVVYATGVGASNPGKPDIHKLSPAGAELDTLSVAEPWALAVGPEGEVYVADDQYNQGIVPQPQVKIHTFSASGQLLGTFSDPFSNETPNGLGKVIGITANAVTPEGEVAVYVANRAISAIPDFLRAYSPIPDPDLVGDPPSVPPAVATEFATEVGVTDAVVGAEINPRFWEDTSYYLEYGDQGPCDANPCSELHAPGIALGAGVTDTPQKVGIPIPGLEADTTYHFRFVASSGGGGPTFGDGSTFTTFPPNPEPVTDCPNQEFRTGPSARLPDCRAYEMVSPLDKNNGDISQAATMRADPEGEGLAYGSFVAFGDAQSAPFSSHYIADRDPEDGWSSHSINPPIGKVLSIDQFAEGYDHTIAYSEDLQSSWFTSNADPILEPEGIPGFRNIYRRDDPGESYTALTTVEPPSTAPEYYLPRLRVIAPDGEAALFDANAKLTADASSATAADGTIRQLYLKRDGEPPELVSVLPGGTASDEPSTVGGGGSFTKGAFSEDGSRIYWTTGGDIGPQIESLGGLVAGQIYVRLNGNETRAVSETVSSQPARFWAGSADGSEALFTIGAGDELYRYTLATQSSSLLAEGVEGAFATSDDLQSGYVVSTEVLDPDPNEHGDSAIAGEKNVFRFEGGDQFRYVASINVDHPTGKPLYGDEVLIGSSLLNRLSQSTGEGRYLVFMTSSPLTGYDTTDAVRGVPDLEVYRYDAQSEELDCISCNPSGARPKGAGSGLKDGTAAQITGWIVGPFHQQRAVSADGDRVFFESYDDLLPTDTNGKLDVYQWQLVDTGGCTTDSAYYFPQNGGCLDLISTGKSAADTNFFEASEDGDSVFIHTRQSLLSQDPGLFDVYAARVGGGFPPPPEPPVPCEGDGCQPPATDPEPTTPGSGGFEGAEDPEVPADCRSATGKAKKAAKQAKQAKRKAKRAKRKAKRAHGKPARRLRRKAKQKRRAAKRAKGKARRAERAAQRCRSGTGASATAHTAREGRWGL